MIGKGLNLKLFGSINHNNLVQECSKPFSWGNILHSDTARLKIRKFISICNYLKVIGKRLNLAIFDQ